MNQLEQFREQCLNLVGSLDCAHRCGVGQEIAEKIRALPLPEVNQEPALYQCRIAPNWLSPSQWTEWEKCTKEQYADYIKVQELHDWLYETRTLYLLPPDAEALRKEIEILKALNEHLQKENQSFYESDDHEFQAIYQDLIRDLGIPFGGSVIETVNKIQSQNARLTRTLHFVERCANHHGQNPKISAAEVLSMIQHYPDIEDITKSYADGVVPDTPNPYADQEPVAAMHVGFDYLDNGQLVATYALKVRAEVAPNLYALPPDVKALRKENDQLRETLKEALDLMEYNADYFPESGAEDRSTIEKIKAVLGITTPQPKTATGHVMFKTDGMMIASDPDGHVRVKMSGMNDGGAA